MTRRDYTKLASALAISNPGAAGYTGLTQQEIWRGTVHNIADVLQAGNPRFDRARFLTAAGIELGRPQSVAAAA